MKQLARQKQGLFEKSDVAERKAILKTKARSRGYGGRSCAAEGLVPRPHCQFLYGSSQEAAP